MKQNLDIIKEFYNNKATNINITVLKSCSKLRGGGGGVNPDFLVKLFFETAGAQQTRTPDQTFEGVVDPNCPLVPAVQPRPSYMVQF